MDQSLVQIIYVSSAAPELNEEALADLLAKSRARNEARGITGLLLHVDGNLIHIIEGEERAVSNLFEKIKRDSRHRGILLLSRRPIKKRDFPDYQMGFKREKTKDLINVLPGFTDIVEKRQITQNATKGRSPFVASLLKTFARTTRLEEI